MHFSQRKSVTKWLVFLLAQVSLHSDLPIIPSLGHTCPAFGYSICLNFWAHRWKLWKVISWGLNIVNHENGCLELFHSALIEHHILSGWATHVFSEKFVHFCDNAEPSRARTEDCLAWIWGSHWTLLPLICFLFTVFEEKKTITCHSVFPFLGQII